MKVISGSSNPNLAQKIAKELDLTIVEIEIDKFKNQEKKIWIKENLEGENVCLVQSLSDPTDENIIELLLIIDALERAGARHVNLIIPWMGYSLQDKVFLPGQPISAKVIANLISNTYVKRAYLLDLHNPSIPGFFDTPTQHLEAMDLFVNHIHDNFNVKNTVVISPDFGGLKRSKVFADKLGVELLNINKSRDLETQKVTPINISGDVTRKICFVYDDVINTGSTVAETAKFLKSKGASEVHFVVTHGIFADNGLDKMNDESIDSIVITDSISHQSLPKKIKVLSCASIFVPHLKKWL
jgi:ribose-phosphate pyrophosphokinase